jgi:hypothetical protein
MNEARSTAIARTFGPAASGTGGTATAIIAALALGMPATAGAGARARVARHRSGNATAHLHLLHSSGGSTLIEEGSVSGGLSGHMRARLHVSATFTGSFTFYTRGGQIRGRGSAHPHGSGRYQSFAGTEVITGGTGRYAHARGHGRMYGKFDRRTYAVVIHTRGTISY